MDHEDSVPRLLSLDEASRLAQPPAVVQVGGDPVQLVEWEWWALSSDADQMITDFGGLSPDDVELPAIQLSANQLAFEFDADFLPTAALFVGFADVGANGAPRTPLAPDHEIWCDFLDTQECEVSMGWQEERVQLSVPALESWKVRFITIQLEWALEQRIESSPVLRATWVARVE